MSRSIQGLHRWLGVSAGLFGFAAVALGALGSHVVDLPDARASSLWATALEMHLFQTAALLALTAISFHASNSRLPVCGLILALGTLLFCGSLYLRAAGWEVLPGFVAPAGGMLMMASWLGFILIWVTNR